MTLFVDLARHLVGSPVLDQVQVQYTVRCISRSTSHSFAFLSSSRSSVTQASAREISILASVQHCATAANVRSPHPLACRAEGSRESQACSGG